jgi:hypothetical protein
VIGLRVETYFAKGFPGRKAATEAAMSYIILTEEKSMQVFLEALFKRHLPAIKYRVVPHEGKNDLKRSISSKLKLYKNSDEKVIVLIDQDSADCRSLKDEIVTLCQKSGATNYTVRIVCHELESWYLGDLSSVDSACGTRLAIRVGTRKFRDPDALGNPKQILKNETRQTSQLYIADQIGKVMSVESIAANTSKSFQVFRRTIGLCL